MREVEIEMGRDTLLQCRYQSDELLATSETSKSFWNFFKEHTRMRWLEEAVPNAGPAAVTKLIGLERARMIEPQGGTLRITSDGIHSLGGLAPRVRSENI
jgi:hypothetical protein